MASRVARGSAWGEGSGRGPRRGAGCERPVARQQRGIPQGAAFRLQGHDWIRRCRELPPGGPASGRTHARRARRCAGRSDLFRGRAQGPCVVADDARHEAPCQPQGGRHPPQMRTPLAIVAVVAFFAALWWFHGRGPEPATPAQRVAAAPRVEPKPASPSSSKTPAPVVAPQSQPRQMPYAFVGKLTEEGKTTIVLHGGGKTIRVQGTGPIDERYEVVAIHDDRLELRDGPTGKTEMLALAARGPMTVPMAPDESERD